MPEAQRSRRLPRTRPHKIEWPTLALLALCFGGWIGSVFILPEIGLWLAIPALILSLALHSSLTHEVLHGHPFPSRRLSEALVHINPGLAIPYMRFRDTHLAHHQDSRLTDPYDDPETHYLDPAVWARLPRAMQWALRVNNTLAGRMAIGPLIAQIAFMACDARAILKGDRQVLFGWVLHVPGAIFVVWLVLQSPMPLWAYLVGAYLALSVLKIRTFLEHQAHEKARGRTVVVEDRGLLALLFLNNNYHVVHHMHPKVPWYDLPGLYAANKDRYLRRNEGYVYTNYAQIFRRHFFRAKDPVAHPLWPPAE